MITSCIDMPRLVAIMLHDPPKTTNRNNNIVLKSGNLIIIDKELVIHHIEYNDEEKQKLLRLIEIEKQIKILNLEKTKLKEELDP